MREPGYTCPDIDDAISDIESFYDEVKDNLDSMKTKAVAALEEMRKANEKIREWGAWYKERAEGLEDELATAQTRIEELENVEKAA